MGRPMGWCYRCGKRVKGLGLCNRCHRVAVRDIEQRQRLPVGGLSCPNDGPWIPDDYIKLPLNQFGGSNTCPRQWPRHWDEDASAWQENAIRAWEDGP